MAGRVLRLREAGVARLRRASLVRSVARRLHCDRAAAERAVAVILDASGEALRRGETLDPGGALGMRIRRRAPR